LDLFSISASRPASSTSKESSLKDIVVMASSNLIQSASK